MKKILFVCTGNSCRSVMAQGWLTHLVAKSGHNDVQVISAGVSTPGGFGATPETIEVMRAHGADVSGHVGRPVTKELLQNADLIFCMEEFHKEEIVALLPEVESKVHLLKTFQAQKPSLDPNIPDPIGRPKEVYESCFLTIQEAVERLHRWIARV